MPLFPPVLRVHDHISRVAGHGLTINLGDLPTWVAAIGTVGALAAAFWQIGTERGIRQRREAQELVDRHFEQARLISAVVGPEDPIPRPWNPDGRTQVELINGSAEPVYGLVVAIVAIQGTLPRSIEVTLQREGRRPFGGRPIAVASILPRGTYCVWIDGLKWVVGAGFNRPAAEVAFTDRAGNHWIRRASGKLEELPEDPWEYFSKLGLHKPFDIQTPERLP
jgi:hypothetical protein